MDGEDRREDGQAESAAATQTSYQARERILITSLLAVILVKCTRTWKNPTFCFD